MSTWYLGPDGDLRALPTPERDVTVTTVRYGGVHQALSGARTMDVTGHRSEYAFSFRYLEPEEYAWLDALHTRHIPGPLRLFNPMRHNRLSPQAASVQPAEGASVGVTVPGLWNWAYDWPPGVGLGARCVHWTNYPANAVLSFDADRHTAVLPGESVTASVYVHVDSAPTKVELRLTFYDRAGDLLQFVTSDRTFAARWQREALTWPVPQDAVTVGFSLAAPATPVGLRLAAAQIEPGTAATAWHFGGAAPQVLMDQLTTSSPRFPLVDCALTLLEA